MGCSIECSIFIKQFTLRKTLTSQPLLPHVEGEQILKSLAL